MGIDESDRGFLVRARSARMRRFLGAPVWYLKLRLGWTRSAIDRVERQLSGEFGLIETSPLHDELALLLVERDALIKSLGESK